MSSPYGRAVYQPNSYATRIPYPTVDMPMYPMAATPALQQTYDVATGIAQNVLQTPQQAPNQVSSKGTPTDSPVVNQSSAPNYF